MGLIHDNRRLLLVGIALGLLVVASGCDRESNNDQEQEPAQQSEDESRLELRPFEPPESVSLVEPPSNKRKRLDLGEPLRYPACRDIFEPDGEVEAEFLPDRDRKEWVVYGCSPEAYRKLPDGRRYLAYRLAPHSSEGRDLRLIAYDAEGTKAWSYLLSRADYTENFTANFRSSFITPLLPHLVCVGTLWAGDTQLSCLDAESGEPEWEGDLGFWSGIALKGHEVKLHGADIRGLTRRYPYSGVEMERTDFEYDGGHSALYVTDGERLFFAPKEGEPSQLTAYAFASMKPVWRTELPERPDPGFTDAAFVEHETVAVKIEERLYGFNSTSGAVRWAFEIGDDRPPIVAGPEFLYLLLQRPERPSLLFAIAPDTGTIDWYAPVPTGTLDLAWVDETLLIRSVRAFQPVRGEK